MAGGYAIADRLIYRDGKMVLESRHPGGELLVWELIERSPSAGARTFVLADDDMADYFTLSANGVVRYFEWNGAPYPVSRATFIASNAMTIGRSDAKPKGTWRPPQRPAQEEGIQVSGYASRSHKWPLVGIREGRIVCLPDFLVFFKAPSDVLYAVNGSARDAVYDGKVNGRDIWTTGILKPNLIYGNGYAVALLWIEVGLELCDGNLSGAKRIAGEANRIAREPANR